MDSVRTQTKFLTVTNLYKSLDQEYKSLSGRLVETYRELYVVHFDDDDCVIPLEEKTKLVLLTRAVALEAQLQDIEQEMLACGSALQK